MKNPSEIDYQPLEKFKSAWDIAFNQLKSNKWFWIGVILTAVVAVFVPMIAIFGLGIMLFLLANKVSALQKEAWLEFGKANGWIVAPTGAENEYLPPSIKGIGHSQKLSPVLQMQMDESTWNLLSYNFTTGSGKHSHTYSFTIIGMPVAETFPYIVLDNKKNYGGVQRIHDGCVKVTLEGNFNQYFKMYIQKGSQIDALSIITPDVMQTLIDKNLNQDIEISGNNLYFIAVMDQRSPQALRSLVDSAYLVSGELLRRKRSLGYSLEQLAKQETNAVKTPGIRWGIIFLATVIGSVVLVIFVWLAILVRSGSLTGL